MDLIGREHPTSDDKPPWAGMVFKQVVYSDAMLENLKRRYPHGANLRERKHMAAIEFLQQELRDMQANEAASVPEAHPAVSVPDVRTFDHENRRSISPPCSPTAACPSSAVKNERYHEMSPPCTRLSEELPSMSRMMSGQEIVFSIVDGPIVQRRRRKKMTATEKIAYKQIRRVGACDSCKRQKAKVDSPSLLGNKMRVHKADTRQCNHVSGAANEPRNSQAATSIPRRDSRSASDARRLHSIAKGERKGQTRASELSQELSPERNNTSLQSPSNETPATVTGSPRCAQDMPTGAQSDSSGYVPVSTTSGLFEVSSHSVFESQTSTIDPQLLMMGYSNHVGFNEFSTQGTLPSSDVNPRNIPGAVWSQVQGFHAYGTHPG